MPAFSAKYGPKVWEVLYAECIDNSRGLTDVLRAARAGELQGLDAAQQATMGAMGYGYASRKLKDERLLRQGLNRRRKDPGKVSRDLLARLVTRAELEVKHIERQGKGSMDTGQSLAIVELIRRAAIATRELNTTAPVPARGKTTSSAPAGPATLAERIAAAAQAPEQDEPTTTADNGQGAVLTQDGLDAASQNGPSGGAVRLRAASPAAEHGT